MSDLRKEFEREMRRTVPAEFRDLLEAATEVHVKHGLQRGNEATRRKKTIVEGPEWERLRSALMDLERAGYVGYEWKL